MKRVKLLYALIALFTLPVNSLLAQAGGTPKGNVPDATVVQRKNIGTPAGSPQGGMNSLIQGLFNLNKDARPMWPQDSTGQVELESKKKAWLLSGNMAGLTSFIGTINPQSFLVKVNNMPAGKIDWPLSNTYWGLNAGLTNVSGKKNTAIGVEALLSNVAGNGATAIGFGALKYSNNNDTSFENKNVAIGFESLRGAENASSNKGNSNTAVGYTSMQRNTKGNSNTAVGESTLVENTVGSYNTAFGAHALYSNTTGEYNTALGTGTLAFNVAGNNATAIGVQAMLYSNNSTTPFVNYNVAMGYEALRGSNLPVNNTGNYNTALGFQSILLNSTGSFNTATGHYSMERNTTGISNTAIGSMALRFNTAGSFNTAIGDSSLWSNTIGNNNTALGYFANVSDSSLTNATALGANAVVNASNKIRLGDASVTVIEGTVPFSPPSDGRFKEEVKEDVMGLDFIMQLRPVTYQFNRLRYAQHSGQQLTTDSEKTLAQQSQKRSSGFIAQEVEKIVAETGFTSFDAVHAPTNETDNYSMGYAEFVVPLVKAVQEQQVQIEALKKENEELRSTQGDRWAEHQKQMNELQSLYLALKEELANR